LSNSRRNKRSLSLDRKLAVYTLTATAVVAAPQAMKADGITYVPNVNQTVSFSYDPTTGNSTSTPDYTLSLPGTAQSITFSATSVGSFADVSAGAALLEDVNGNPAALAAGALIDPSATANFGTSGKIADPFGKGNFPVNGEAYLGFYFTEADGLHAGWADLTTAGSADGNSRSLTLNSYAYNNVANQSILAGQTVATPEPTSISLIAMGAAGLAELRRRRRKYAEAA
jgi:hypothetical protein